MSNTPYPAAPGQSGSINNLQSLLGIGAYSAPSPDGAGNGGNFGQDISEQFVKSLISTTAMNMGPGDGSLGDIFNNLASYIGQLGLDSLKMLQPLIPGATDDDFKDTNTAVAYIMNALNIQLLMSGQEFTQWITDIFDPNSVLWTDAKAKWDALMAQLNSYPPAGSSAATVAVWWSTLLVDLGGDPTLSATIGNIIAGNYDWAKSAKDNWDAFLATWGLTPGQAGTSMTNQLAWWARLPENLLITLDGMHIFYPLGSPSDTPTTTVGGKRTWYAAKADMALMQGQTNGTATPTITIDADVGTFAQTTQTRVVDNEDTLSKVQARVDALAADDSSVAGAKYVAPANGGTGASWGPDWTVTASVGTIAPASALDVYSFTLPGSSSVDMKLTGKYANVTLTDDQVASLVFYSAAGNMGGSFGPRNRLKARMDAGGTNYVFVDVNYTTITIGCQIAGVDTVWQTLTGQSVPAGALVELYCGNATNHRAYMVKVNGTAITVLINGSGGFTDGSNMGASYRGGGQDMLASHGSFNDVWAPAQIRQFSLRDSNVQAVTYGTSGRWYRNTTTGATVGPAVNAVQPLVTNIFNAVDYASPDVSLQAGGLVINTPGRYRLQVQIRLSAAASNQSIDLLRTNGAGTTIQVVGFYQPTNTALAVEQSFEFNALGDGSEAFFVGLDLPSVAPTTVSRTIIGDGNGWTTWMTLTRIA